MQKAMHATSESVLSAEYDRVMPIFDDESLYLAHRLPSALGCKALDLGTGSGILAAHMAETAEETIGSDINPKAVDYARVAVARLEALNRCTFCVGDLFGAVEELCFDMIVTNPPFVPLPFGFRMFLSADGGPDGLDVVRRILAGINDFLTADGRFLMLTLSLGDGCEPLIYHHLREAFCKRRVEIRTTHIYESVRIEAEPFFQLFESVTTYPDWRRFLEKRDLTHLYYMLHEVTPHDRFDHVELQNTIPLEQTEFSGSWAGRLNRFRTWFDRTCLRHGEASPCEGSTQGGDSLDATDVGIVSS